MNTDPVAQTYAQALVETAEQRGLLDEVAEEVTFLAQTLRDDGNLRLFVENPRIEKSAKIELFERALRGKLSDVLVNFVLLLVEKHLSRHILEHIGEVGEFDARPGAGMAVQIDVDDAVGIRSQVQKITEMVGEDLE